MDFPDFLDGRRVFADFQKRVRGLSEGFARKIGNARPRVAALKRRALIGALFAGSAALGLLAQDQAKAQALWDFNHSRSPSPRIWDQALQAHHYSRVLESRRLERALRSLPATLDSSDSAWATRGAGWIAILGRASATGSASVYCDPLSCGEKPTEWEPLGPGWIGFDQLMAKIESSATNRGRPLRPGRLRSRDSEYRDSREIRY